MENDIYNETKRISKITENNSLENLIIQKRLNLSKILLSLINFIKHCLIFINFIMFIVL